MPPLDSPTTTCWRNAVTGGGRRSVRPAGHRVARHRDDDVVRELVVPALTLLVPEHPEVAEVAHQPGDDVSEPADRGAAEADRPAVAEVDHPNAEQSLADRLPRVAPLEVAVVEKPDDECDDNADRVSGGDPQHDVDD